MSAFKPLPLGRTIPNRVHAVSCSLPTIEAVRGYEEKKPEITAHLTSGYPRFVVHPLVLQLTAYYYKQSGFVGLKLWLVSSEKIANRLEAYLKSASSVTRFHADGIYGVAHKDDADTNAKAKSFLQHMGGFLPSRQAEDQLVKLGLLAKAAEEELYQGESETTIKQYLQKALPGASSEDLFLTGSGMNAIYSAFKSVSEIQAKKGKTIWIQIGWLYLDTIAILKKFTSSPSDYIFISNIFDLGALQYLLEKQGAKIAGVITEIPSNPLVQTSDVKLLSSLCKKYDVSLILDTSIASLFSVNVYLYADVLVNSLTKYTASEGDLIAGLAAINPKSKDASELRRLIGNSREILYVRDMARLAAQILNTEVVLAKIADNTLRVAQFLEKDSRVDSVFWALEPKSKDNYLAIARSPTSVGSMITFSVKGSLDTFYDRLSFPKGPSFGMKTTLICPFMYLAHYDMVNSAEGRRELLSHGINADILRLSVGSEPIEDIIEALNLALG